MGDFGEYDSSHVLEGSNFGVEISPLPDERTVSDTLNLYPGIVKLITRHGIGNATGFFISPDMLVTAAHVAALRGLYFRDPVTGNRVFTEIFRFDEKHDLALLLAVDYESEHFFPVGSTSTRLVYEPGFGLQEVKWGDSVVIPGFPQGSFNTLQGIVTGRLGFSYYTRITDKTSKEISHFAGASGSPVFSGEDLIGVVSYGNSPHFPIEFIGFTPVEKLRDLIERSEAEEQRIRRRLFQEILYIKKIGYSFESFHSEIENSFNSK